MNISDAYFTVCQDGQANDEGYRRVLKQRSLAFLAVAILGVITALLPLVAESFHWQINAHNLGYFSGLGCGLAGSCGVLYLRMRRTLKNTEKLRKERIQFYDERLREITRRAWGAAGYVLLIALYLVGIIGGLFYPILHTVLAGLAMVFLLSYALAYWIFSKKM